METFFYFRETYTGENKAIVSFSENKRGRLYNDSRWFSPNEAYDQIQRESPLYAKLQR